jgi:hypothetical protein
MEAGDGAGGAATTTSAQFVFSFFKMQLLVYNF